MFKFKPSASNNEITTVNAAFESLVSKIPELKSIEMGENNSPEGINKGLTHGYILTFEDEAGRETYLSHQHHKSFQKLVDPLLDDVLVFDFTI